MKDALPVIKKMVHWFAVVCAIVFALMFFMLLTAHAASPMDYPALESQFTKLNERLARQEEMVQADLDYVQGALASFPPNEAALKTRASKLRRAAQQCRDDLASRVLDVCTVKSRGRQISIGQAESTARDCDKRAGQCGTFLSEANLDARALSDRLREIATLRNDLQEWKAMHDEALADELRAVGVFMFGQFAEYMADQAKAIRSINSMISRNKAKLIAQGMDVPLAESRLLELHQRLLMTKIASTAGETMKQVDPAGLYQLLEDTVILVARLEEDTVAAVKAIAEEPAMKDLLKKEYLGLELTGIVVQKVPEKLLEMKHYQKMLNITKKSKVMPAIGIASLVIDTAYNASKWGVSLSQIMDRYTLAEKSKDAADSLHALIERRKPRWRLCLEL